MQAGMIASSLSGKSTAGQRNHFICVFCLQERKTRSPDHLLSSLVDYQGSDRWVFLCKTVALE
eukprot:scaffold57447_cov16-Tisochrysis_lutea.AAC.1